MALNWLMCKGAVPVSGAKARAQAEQNAGALGWRLQPQDVVALDQLTSYARRGWFRRLWQRG